MHARIAASVANPDVAIRYPKRMALQRISDDVVAQYVVNAQGRVPGESWRAPREQVQVQPVGLGRAISREIG